MTMTAWQGILTIAAVTLGTLCTRFLPFLVFPESKQLPKLVEYFGKVLPYAMTGLLVVYALRNTPILTGRTAFRNSSPVPSSHCCICGSATCCFRPPAAPRCICC